MFAPRITDDRVAADFSRAEITVDSDRRSQRLAAWRLARLRDDVQRAVAASDSPMRIAISGMGGLLGGDAALWLAAAGHTVERLSRRAGSSAACPPVATRQIAWEPGSTEGSGEVDLAALAGCGAVLHYAGEPIRPRMNAEQVQMVRDSRLAGTRTLARAIASLSDRPKVFIVASGSGYYGDRGEEEVTEVSGVGSGEFAEIARDWESAADPARQAGVRVVHLRLGMVVTPRSGALRAMLPLFRVGMGCIVGSGRQYWSWISPDDALGTMILALSNQSLSGPVNTVSPAPIRAADFARSLAKVCDRSLFAKAPAWTIRLALGSIAEPVLASARVAPETLRREGFRHLHPALESALLWELAAGGPEEWGVSVDSA